MLARAPLEFLGDDVVSLFGSKLRMMSRHDLDWIDLRMIPTPGTRVGVTIADPYALEVGAWNQQG